MALILIADDDELVVDVVRAALGTRGHIVGAVDDGMPVAGIVEFKRPELVLLDFNMPELCGIDALRQIRALRNAYATPVLMLTACRGEFEEELAMRAGANDYLRKPFDSAQLVSRVETLLRRAALKNQPAAPPPMLRPLPQAPRAWGQR
ncbi:MAG: two-component system, OmpR family, phosphate regulon response regulator OmpR [Thermoleophilaceae bacterium]|nr:two-component system, OmpR family, phosphate regulon response regulator OmpR [Thermoleophilaceae bacterium]